MRHIKAVLSSLGLSCAVIAVPIAVHATVIETKTFKNSTPGGNAATDLKITSNRHPFAARSDKFEFNDISGNDIMFRGGSLAQGASTTVTISYAGTDKVVKNSASFSFATGPDVPITSPIVGELGGQIQIGTGFHGFLQLTNDGSTPLFFTNFLAAVNVPASFFSDIESQAALAVLTDNNLFIGQGTLVALPSTFSLAAGEIRDFDLGPMTGTDFIASFFDVGFSLGVPDTTFGIAAQGVIPEPSTFLLLASGLLPLALLLWKRRPAPMTRKVLITGGMVALFVHFAPMAYAGLVKVDNMQPGSTASLEVKDKDGGTIFKGDMVDVNQDGKVEFGVQNQAGFKDVLVWKTNTDLQRVHYDGKFASLPLPSLEPFALPTFGAVNPAVALFTTVDIEAFLGAPNPFIAGQTIAITNGLTPLSAALSFKDFTGVPFPTPGPFDLSIIPGLPNFTGTVRVSPAFDSFEPIPEPSTYLLLGSGLAGIIWWRRRVRYGDQPTGER